MEYYSVNGEIVPVAQARLGAADLGLLRGYGVFDYFRVVRGTPLFIDDYLARFERSVNLLNMELPVTLAELKRHIHELIEANSASEAGVRLLLTGGYSPDGFTPAEPNLVVLEHPLTPPDEERYRRGSNLTVYEYVRDIPEVKTTNYAVAIQQLPQQRAADAIDVLYHQQGRVSETSRSNIFIVKAGVILTPGERILRGITRKQILHLARERFEVQETEITLEDVYSADEVFITSSVKGVMPIVKVGESVIGSGQPGDVSRQLVKAFAAHVEDYLVARGRYPQPDLQPVNNAV